MIKKFITFLRSIFCTSVTTVVKPLPDVEDAVVEKKEVKAEAAIKPSKPKKKRAPRKKKIEEK